MNAKKTIRVLFLVLPPLILWILAMVFEPDRAFFDYGKEVDGKYFIIKVLFLILLCATWLFVRKVYHMVNEGNRLYKRGIMFFLIYFVLMLILLVIMWPGAWAWDDIWILNSIQWYNFFCPWQNVITGIYYDLMLQFLPFPGGIILMQVMIISLCDAYVISGLESTFDLYLIKRRHLDTFIKIIPFILFPVLIYNFSGYRASLAAHLELVLIVTLIRSIKDNKVWKISELISFGILTTIVSNWRTESFVYIILVTVLILLNRTIYNGKIRIILVAVMVLAFAGVHKYQAGEIGNSNYEIVSLMGQCGELVRNADESLYKNEIDRIDRVVSVDVIRDNPGADGTMLYFGLQAVRDGYSREEYREFIKALIKLSANYPNVLITERWKTCMMAMGLNGLHDNISMTADLFDEGSQGAEFFKNKDLIAPYPFFPSLRKKLVHILCCERDDGTPILFLQLILWNVLIPLIALAGSFIYFIKKKEWKYLLIVTCILCKMFIVVMMQPAGTFMYLYPFYLMGYLLIIYCLLYRRIKV